MYMFIFFIALMVVFRVFSSRWFIASYYLPSGKGSEAHIIDI